MKNRVIRLKPAKRLYKVITNGQWKHFNGHSVYFRSRWEARVATYLEMLQNGLQIAKWEHEPQIFWFLNIKRGVRSYLPDFKVTRLDGTHYWIEVKGYMDAKSKTKIKRFKKYYPNEELVLFDKEWFLKNNHLLPKE